MNFDETIIKEFIFECRDHLENIESTLLDLDPDNQKINPDMFESIFRSIHSTKSTAGFLQLNKMQQLTHAMETVLSTLVTGQVRLGNKIIDMLLKGIDSLRKMLDDISNSNQMNIKEVCAGLEKCCQQQIPFDREFAENNITMEPIMTHSDIRVDLEKLDVLVNLVGELVIAEAMVTRNPEIMDLKLKDFDRAVRNLRRIIIDLQDVVMNVRMVPLTKTFHKIKRLVHDLEKKTGKKIHMELIGEDTEVDKTVIELLADPLVHIIRNSIDHGIESPRERRAAGKSEIGKITIAARHQSGEVYICIADDGAGLNHTKLLEAAISKGIITREAGLNQDQIHKLIFHPGLSTTSKVTDISGRGVGMDVVRKNLDKLQGRIEIQNFTGQGLRLNLRIPLTLAIIDGMLVRVGDACYTIPLMAIHSSFRPKKTDLQVVMEGLEMVRIREDLIPVMRLHQLYDLNPDYTRLEEGILIKVGAGTKRVCLFVDEILGHRQTVIKALPDYIGTARGISGCTILGDGCVSLIIDIAGIINLEESDQISLDIMDDPEEEDNEFDDLYDDEEEDTRKDQYLCFQIEQKFYGLAIEDVAEIVWVRNITKVPDIPVYIKGVINLRGQVIPVMDARTRFKIPERKFDARTCIIILTIKNITVGLIVDRVKEVIKIPEDKITPPPQIAEDITCFMMGLGKVEGAVKILLDVNKLFYSSKEEGYAKD